MVRPIDVRSKVRMEEMGYRISDQVRIGGTRGYTPSRTGLSTSRDRTSEEYLLHGCWYASCVHAGGLSR